jgi:hypothetical protein
LRKQKKPIPRSLKYAKRLFNMLMAQASLKGALFSAHPQAHLANYVIRRSLSLCLSCTLPSQGEAAKFMRLWCLLFFLSFHPPLAQDGFNFAHLISEIALWRPLRFGRPF